MRNLAQAFKVHTILSLSMSAYNYDHDVSKYLKDFCISNDLQHTAGNKQKTIPYDDGSAIIIQHEHYYALYYDENQCDHLVYAKDANNKQTYRLVINNFKLVEIIKSQ